ncbi:MAG: flagellar biosynthesis protein FlhF [Desulfobacteraceae bacterium]
MNIKRFIADTAQEAMRLAKKEMGSEAVVLRTRSVRVPGDGNGGPRRKIEITAAVDYDAPIVTAQDAGPGSMTPSAMMERWAALEAELREIKTAILSADTERSLSPEVYFDSYIRSIYGHFKSMNLTPELVQELMNETRQGPRPKEQSGSAVLQEALSRVLRRIRISRPGEQKGERGIYAFIGPTGVGKTTTLAKLAALRAVKQGVSTVLITLDTFRISAVSQLRTYADIMNVPLEVASSANELHKALERSRDADLVLIDTAGRSPNHEEDIDELCRMFNGREDIHHFLVLSATTQLDSLFRAAERFGRLPYRSIIFTKLDEAEDASHMINFLVSGDRPISYFTTGQQVPEDIESATKKRLAELMLGKLRGKAGFIRNPDEVGEHGSGNRPKVLGRG